MKTGNGDASQWFRYPQICDFTIMRGRERSLNKLPQKILQFFFFTFEWVSSNVSFWQIPPPSHAHTHLKTLMYILLGEGAFGKKFWKMHQNWSNIQKHKKMLTPRRFCVGAPAPFNKSLRSLARLLCLIIWSIYIFSWSGYNSLSN